MSLHRRLEEIRQEEGQAALNQHNLDFGPEVLEHIEQRLPTEIQKHIQQGRILAGSFNQDVPQAFTEQVGSEGWIVCLSSGLRSILYSLSRIVVSVPSYLTVENAAEQVLALANQFHSEFPAVVAGPSAFNGERVLQAVSLAMEAQGFLVAHELGHVSVMSKGASFMDVHEEEFWADQFAICTMLDVKRKSFGLDDPIRWAYQGSDLALRLYKMLEKVGLGLPATHPSAAERLERIQQIAATVVPNWQEIAGIQASILDTALARYSANPKDPTLGMMEDFLKSFALDVENRRKR